MGQASSPPMLPGSCYLPPTPPHLTLWSFLYIRLTHLGHTLLCWQQFCVVIVKVAPGSFSPFFLLLLHHNITLLSLALTLDLLEKKRLHCDDF